MSKEIVDLLVQILTEDMDVVPEATVVAGDTRLFDDGLGLDSFGVVEYISLIEQKFKIEFAEQDLDPQNFVTIAGLAKLVAARLREAAGGAGVERRPQ